jgi:3-hydroxyisobutyrate dehydrogenase-like beta-hydroxyacid dehydrogenase
LSSPAGGRRDPGDGGARPRAFGFVGLGNIGMPMAERLAASGQPTFVFDLRDAACTQLAGRGVTVAASCADLAARATLIGICVRDDADVRDVVLGEDGLLAGAAPGTLLAVHSTILPRTAVELAATCKPRGVDLIDAAVTGGSAGAAAGTLCTMVGGDAGLVERFRPAAECYSARIVHTGALGSGAATKLCNNLMLYLGYLAVAEGTLLADAAGLSRDALFEVTSHSGVLTEAMRRFLPAREIGRGSPGDARIRELLGPFADLAEKDLTQAVAHARALGVELPGTALCKELMYEVYGLGPKAGGSEGGRDG